MKQRPDTRLHVTRKSHWLAPHYEQRYTTKFSLVDRDIVYIHVEAHAGDGNTVLLDHVDFDMYHSVLQESGLDSKPTCAVINMDGIRNCTLRYKKDLVNLLYNRGPAFEFLVLCHVHPDMLLTAETFIAITPDKSKVALAETEKEAFEMVMARKAGRSGTLPPGDPEKAQHETLKKEFLASMARIVWLNLPNYRVPVRAEERRYSFLFASLRDMQNDLREKDALHERRKKSLLKRSEQKIAEKTLQLQALQALNHNIQTQLGRKQTEIATARASRDIILARLADALAEKKAKAERLRRLVEDLDIEQELKKHIVHQLCELSGTASPGAPGAGLSPAEKELLSKLKQRHPQLGGRELKVALMIKQNFDNAEIAPVLGITPRGVETLRYRMHKKMGLAKHESIKNYLLDLTAAIR